MGFIPDESCLISINSSLNKLIQHERGLFTTTHSCGKNINMKDFRTLTFILCMALTGLVTAGAQPSLHEQFNTPPKEAKPWTFWYWMYGAVSKEGIKADLESMKEIGLGGAYLMTIKSTSQGPGYKNAVSQLSPEWWEMVRYSMEQADRLHLKLGMHISDGFALAGGPWITPKESMQ
jgi:hypothetical protein